MKKRDNTGARGGGDDDGRSVDDEGRSKRADGTKIVDLSSPQVGYRSPPREHQFKPGISGNPSGSIKNKRLSPELKRSFLEVAYKQVPFKTAAGEIETQPFIQLFVRAFLIAAMKDPAMGKLYLREELEHARKLPNVPVRGTVRKTPTGAFYTELITESEIQKLEEIQDLLKEYLDPHGGAR